MIVPAPPRFCVVEEKGTHGEVRVTHRLREGYESSTLTKKSVEDYSQILCIKKSRQCKNAISFNSNMKISCNNKQ